LQPVLVGPVVAVLDPVVAVLELEQMGEIQRDSAVNDRLRPKPLELLVRLL
jgi:hypothetical protein